MLFVPGSSDGPSSSNSSVKESLRHKLKANRRIKQEAGMDVDGQGTEYIVIALSVVLVISNSLLYGFLPRTCRCT